MNRKKRKQFAVVFMLSFLAIIVLFGDKLVLNNPYESNLKLILKSPCIDYPFGTDNLGKGASYITAPTGTSNYFFNILCKSEGEQNFGHYSNPEVDKLIEELSTERDEAKRDKLTKKISEIVANDYALIFYNHQNFTAAYNKETVAKFYPHPSELYILDATAKLK